MKKEKMLLWVPILIFFGMMAYLLWSGEREASAVREEVVRYHVVANSDSAEDQEIKILLRDHLFSEIEALFADCKDREEALSVAQKEGDALKEKGEAFLRQLGVEKELEIAVGERFFPTKTYGNLSFPAGRYQAVSILIGEGKGENFWCVLYPALCLSPAVHHEAGEEKMAFAVGEEGVSFLQKAGEIQKVKFRLVEWFEILRQKIKNS